MSYATKEQAIEWVSEYIKGKGMPVISDPSADYVTYGNEFEEYHVFEDSFETMTFQNNSIELSDRMVFAIPVIAPKEDFLTILKLLDT